MSARDKPLKRTYGKRSPRKLVKIYTEGNTEYEYLTAIKKLDQVRRNASVQIEIATEHAVPMPLVRQVLKDLSSSNCDEIWCVVDVEAPVAHPQLDQAISHIKNHPDIHLAFSNPCFEVWLLMHFRDITRYTTTKEAEKMASGLDGFEQKHIIDPAQFIPRIDQAITRARAARERHCKDGRVFPNDNPSSEMDLLLAGIGLSDLCSMVGPGH